TGCDDDVRAELVDGREHGLGVGIRRRPTRDESVPREHDGVAPIARFRLDRNRLLRQGIDQLRCHGENSSWVLWSTHPLALVPSLYPREPAAPWSIIERV